MTQPQENQAQPAEQQAQQKPNDKEYNFRALEAKYQRQLEQEKQARAEAEKRAQEALQMAQTRHEQDDDDESEPYVDHKKLSKKLSSFEKKIEEKIDKRAEEKARQMVEKERQESWLRQNPDFYDILQHADKFAERDPELAETILQMPNTFERQKLVYKTIKGMGIHKPEVKTSTIQDKVDANRRSPYYQPTGVANAPYASAGDFSESGKKNAYQKMVELRDKLRL